MVSRTTMIDRARTDFNEVGRVSVRFEIFSWFLERAEYRLAGIRTLTINVSANDDEPFRARGPIREEHNTTKRFRTLLLSLIIVGSRQQ